MTAFGSASDSQECGNDDPRICQGMRHKGDEDTIAMPLHLLPCKRCHGQDKKADNQPRQAQERVEHQNVIACKHEVGK